MLTKDGCYLPPKESIKVLKSTDSLKAFHLKVTPCPEENTTKESRKRSIKSVEVEFSSSTPNNPKRSKNKTSITQEEEQASRFENAITREMSRVKELSINKTASTSYKTGRQLKEQSQIRESLQNNVAAEEVSGFKELSINKADNTYHKNAKRTTHKGSISNNHIHFQEEEPASAEVTTTEQNSRSAKVLSPVSFRCPLLEMDSNFTRVFKLPRKPNPVVILENIVIPASSTKMVEEQPQIGAISSKGDQPPSEAICSNGGTEIETIEDAEENIPQVPPSSLPSSQDSEDDVMVLDETNVDDSDSDVETVPLKNDGFSEIIADMLRNAVPLKEPPNIGDTVIFKLSRSKGATAPFPTTEFLAGTCSYINRRTKAMTLSVIGKYINLRGSKNALIH